MDLLTNLVVRNRNARSQSDRPAIRLCSGRPAPYVEVLRQAIDGHLPAVYENVAGLYPPLGYPFTPQPDTRFIADHFQAVQDRLHERLVTTDKAYFQPGNVYSLRLLARKPIETHQLREILRQFEILP